MVNNNFVSPVEFLIEEYILKAMLIFKLIFCGFRFLNFDYFSKIQGGLVGVSWPPPRWCQRMYTTQIHVNVYDLWLLVYTMINSGTQGYLFQILRASRTCLRRSGNFLFSSANTIKTLLVQDVSCVKNYLLHILCWLQSSGYAT